LKHILIGAVVLLMSVFPIITPNNYYLHLIIMMMIYSISAAGLNLMMGYLGLLPLSVAAFAGIGAFTSANLMIRYNMPFLIALLAGVLLAAVVAVAIALPLLRTRGIFYVIGTLSFQLIAYELFLNLIEITGGSIGLRGVPKPEFFGYSLTSFLELYYFIFIMTAVTHFFVYLIIKSDFGRSLLAIRENEAKAISLGLNPYTHKLIAFAISMVISAISGILLTHYLTHISAENFTLLHSIDVFLMVTIGGPGTFHGPIAGAVIWTVVIEILLSFRGLRELLYGVALVVLMLVIPKGAIGFSLPNMRKLFGTSPIRSIVTAIFK
jgi:branched-chain amino acid transport system permease protein